MTDIPADSTQRDTALAIACPNAPTAALAALLACAFAASPVQAQDASRHRTRVALGAQVLPKFPGSDKVSVSPIVSISRARADQPFDFHAADENFGLSLVHGSRFAFGPSVVIQGSRKAKDVGANLPKVDFAVEAGGFVHYYVTPNFRLRASVREVIIGHRGLVGNLSADVIARDADRWLFAAGPRVTLADDRYEAAYFSVTPQGALTSGLPVYSARAGVQSVGGSASLFRQLTDKWGIYAFAKYDRLVGDAARSPIVRRLGSRDQLGGGLALTYTFGGH